MQLQHMYKAIKHIYLLDSFFSFKTVKRRLQREKCLFILKITVILCLLCFALQQYGFAGVAWFLFPVGSSLIVEFMQPG